MDAFSYLSVLLSIILGLGITHLLTAVGRLVRERGHIRFYWPSLLWAFTLLLGATQMWWAMFDLREVPDWRFGGFFLVITQSITFYLAAALVIPEHAEGPTDLRQHYFEQAPWFFAAVVATFSLSMLKDILLLGRLPGGVNAGSHFFVIAICAGALFTGNDRYHRFVAVASAVTMVSYIGLLFTHLG